MKLEDVKKLANLSRIDMSDEEMTILAKDFDPILAYVGQVQEALKLSEDATQGKKPENYFLHNIMREDVVTNTSGQFTDAILADAPDTENGFIKVKQIL